MKTAEEIRAKIEELEKRQRSVGTFQMPSNIDLYYEFQNKINALKWALNEIGVL